jgi:hypothetical protein
MTRLRTTVVAVVSTVALGSGAAVALPAAFADGGGKPAPCSRQQAHVDKGTAKLDAMLAHFAAHPTKKNKREAKAQAQRVAHAANRLAKCIADTPTG